MYIQNVKNHCFESIHTIIGETNISDEFYSVRRRHGIGLSTSRVYNSRSPFVCVCVCVCVCVSRVMAHFMSTHNTYHIDLCSEKEWFQQRIRSIMLNSTPKQTHNSKSSSHTHGLTEEQQSQFDQNMRLVLAEAERLGQYAGKYDALVLASVKTADLFDSRVR